MESASRKESIIATLYIDLQRASHLTKAQHSIFQEKYQPRKQNKSECCRYAPILVSPPTKNNRRNSCSRSLAIKLIKRAHSIPLHPPDGMENFSRSDARGDMKNCAPPAQNEVASIFASLDCLSLALVLISFAHA